MRPAEKGLGIKDWLRGPRQKGETGASPTEISAGKERIAILPFVNISPDPNDEYFADGMTEEMISTLSKIRPLKVISRTSVMRYKQTQKSVQDISKELNVGSILEGSVRKDANELRITVKLIDVRNDEHVWSQDYERKMENVFAVQKEIAKNVVESLRLELVPEDKQRVEKQGTRNIEAYQLYLKGRFLWNKRSKDSMTEAIEYFRTAAKKDPTFAPAYVGIADCYSILVVNGHIPASEGYPRAKQAITRALELDESLAEAHASLGLMRFGDWDWSAAEREYRRAIEINPNYATAHQWLSILFGATFGRTEEGLVEARKALELDPLSPAINLAFGNANLAANNFEEAERHIRRSLELEPGYVDAFESLMLLALEKQSYQEALDILDKMSKMFPSREARSKISMAYVYARSGNQVKAKQVFEKTVAEASRGTINSLHIARYFAGTKDWDRAFEMLDRAYANHDPELCWIGVDPWIRALSVDPRFQSFLKKMRVQ